MQRPYTTLFLLMSVDGKISTGDTDILDVDKDYPEIEGLKEGLSQYYDLEQETDLVSINSGRVLEKVGVNEKTEIPEKTPVSFVVIDSKPHLNEQGIKYLSKKSETLYIVTANENHPANKIASEIENIKIISYKDEVSLEDLLIRLKSEHGVERVTLQTGGMLNSFWVRSGLVDRLLLVVAPALVGGKDTASLIDGKSFHSKEELSDIKTLELVSAKPLKNSYLLLEYLVKN